MPPNTSASGGYLVPSSTQGLPGGLTLLQFIQTLIVGVSALPGNMVRPSWQKEPPKAPDIGVDWVAFGIKEMKNDTYAYTNEKDTSDGADYQRHQGLEVTCYIYGDNSFDNAQLISDGLQINQNLEALKVGNMGFVETQGPVHSPELIDERFRERWMLTVFLRRQVQRVYPIVSILSANGTIHTVIGTEEFLLPFNVEGP